MGETINYKEKIGFSRVVRVRDTIVVAGTAPIRPDGRTAFPGDAYEQTRTCLQIMENAGQEVGGSLTDTIRTRIYLKDRSYWSEAARAHAEYFMDIRPVCTFVIVTGFIQEDWLVEAEMDCLVRKHQVML